MGSRKFPLGKTVATPGAIARMAAGGTNATTLLSRHVSGDWGDICEEDEKQNEWALKNRERLMSVYPVGDLGSPKVWVITERDRSVTTILLPEDY